MRMGVLCGQYLVHRIVDGIKICVDLLHGNVHVDVDDAVCEGHRLELFEGCVRERTWRDIEKDKSEESKEPYNVGGEKGQQCHQMALGRTYGTLVTGRSLCRVRRAWKTSCATRWRRVGCGGGGNGWVERVGSVTGDPGGVPKCCSPLSMSDATE